MDMLFEFEGFVFLFDIFYCCGKFDLFFEVEVLFYFDEIDVSGVICSGIMLVICVNMLVLSLVVVIICYCGLFLDLGNVMVLEF